jgi:hypothetical protein
MIGAIASSIARDLTATNKQALGPYEKLYGMNWHQNEYSLPLAAPRGVQTQSLLFNEYCMVAADPDHLFCLWAIEFILSPVFAVPVSQCDWLSIFTDINSHHIASGIRAVQLGKTPNNKLTFKSGVPRVFENHVKLLFVVLANLGRIANENLRHMVQLVGWLVAASRTNFGWTQVRVEQFQQRTIQLMNQMKGYFGVDKLKRPNFFLLWHFSFITLPLLVKPSFSRSFPGEKKHSKHKRHLQRGTHLPAITSLQRELDLFVLKSIFRRLHWGPKGQYFAKLANLSQIKSTLRPGKSPLILQRLLKKSELVEEQPIRPSVPLRDVPLHVIEFVQQNVFEKFPAEWDCPPFDRVAGIRNGSLSVRQGIDVRCRNGRLGRVEFVYFSKIAGFGIFELREFVDVSADDDLFCLRGVLHPRENDEIEHRRFLCRFTDVDEQVWAVPVFNGYRPNEYLIRGKKHGMVFE